MRDPERRHRQSIRWQEHDYTAGGTYFVTICTADRAYLFGDVLDGEMRVNALGRIVEDEWVRTGVMRPNVEIDVFVVMPNHSHGIVTIRPPEFRMERGGRQQGACNAPLRRSAGSLGSVIAGIKATSTRRITLETNVDVTRVWQRGYYDRVIRTDEEFQAIAEYIVTNPERWQSDSDHVLP
jgi:putative transposase